MFRISMLKKVFFENEVTTGPTINGAMYKVFNSPIDVLEVNTSKWLLFRHSIYIYFNLFFFCSFGWPNALRVMNVHKLIVLRWLQSECTLNVIISFHWILMDATRETLVPAKNSNWIAHFCLFVLFFVRIVFYFFLVTSASIVSIWLDFRPPNNVPNPRWFNSIVYSDIYNLCVFLFYSSSLFFSRNNERCALPRFAFVFVIFCGCCCCWCC